MTAMKTITPLIVLMLAACQTTDRPQPVESKSAIDNSIAAAQAKPKTPPPAAVMPDSVQRELQSSALLSSLSPNQPSEHRSDAIGEKAK